MINENTPPKVNIVRDINLIDNTKLSTIKTICIEKMTEQNYKRLRATDGQKFDQIVTKYGCDICRTRCSEANPIYTNNEYQGVDICSTCIKKAFETIQQSQSLTEPVYSLREFFELNNGILNLRNDVNTIPTKIKIALDINLLDPNDDSFDTEICLIEKVTEKNHENILPQYSSFESAIVANTCDICDAQCDKENPIYTTRKDIEGTDVCSKCIRTAFERIESLPVPDWLQGPIYSLREIHKLNVIPSIVPTVQPSSTCTLDVSNKTCTLDVSNKTCTLDVSNNLEVQSSARCVFTVSNVEPKLIEMKHKYKLNIQDMSVYRMNIAGKILQTSPIDDVYTSSHENGFVGTLFKCYNSHHNVTIRPDDVWIAILTQFSRYVETNAEELRNKFVNFGGKKKVFVSMPSLMTADYGLIAKDLVTEISKNIVDPNIRNWLIPNFSTTTPNDIIVGSIIMMASMQKYFDCYGCICCGIPQVTMMGTTEDWIEVKNRANELLKYDNKAKHMSIWHKLLDPILDNFIKSRKGNPDVEWWNKICSHHSGGSGPSYMSGWLTSFCVFSESGRWLATNFSIFTENQSTTTTTTSPWPVVETTDIPSGYVFVPLKIDDDGMIHDSIMVSGHLGHRISTDLYTLQPAVSWFIGLVDEELIAQYQERGY